MSKRTIEAFAKVTAEQAEKDRVHNVLACTCSNSSCGLTWIICLLPQDLPSIAVLTGRHLYCPHCKEANPQLAEASKIRPLLGSKS